ncbi:MAG: hypothetical protein ABI614_29520, partial [Planctomycetota bacterium]
PSQVDAVLAMMATEADGATAGGGDGETSSCATCLDGEEDEDGETNGGAETPASASYTDGRDLLDKSADFSAGLGDAMSFGIGWVLRDKLFGIRTVDYDSGSYNTGGWAGFAVDVLSGGLAGVAKGSGKAIFKQGVKGVGKEIIEEVAAETVENVVKKEVVAHLDDIARNAPISGANPGKLVFDTATQSWKSAGGLIYGQGSVHGNRVLHVLDHLVPNALKSTHSLFNVGRTQLIGLVDDAWRLKSGPGILQPNGNRVWIVDMGRAIGTNGERFIQIVVRDGTTEIITAFPKLIP